MLRHPLLGRDVSRRLVPTWRDLAAVILVLSMIVLLSMGAREMVAPSRLQQPELTLSPVALPDYALRTTVRMFVALLASLAFTFTYGALAAKSRRAEMVLIPLLDVLQSVPVLGFLSFTVVFFVSLFPGNMLGLELAVIFAIFTSQAWNMAFSFYQSLITIPRDLTEASSCFRFSAWQRFWRLEVPFALPALIWNMMVSVSTGWFYLVASEAISVGDVRVALPGIGSYVARAIEDRNFTAILWAILAMSVVIVLCDQLLFRPLVVWAEKFRFEQTAAQVAPRSWLLDVFRQARLFAVVGKPIGTGIGIMLWARMSPARTLHRFHTRIFSERVIDILWYAVLATVLCFGIWRLVQAVASALSWGDVLDVLGKGAVTLSRVAILVLIATLIWVPLCTLIGLRPRLAAKIQPAVQFLAAFPANLLFPFAVFLVAHFQLAPDIWLSPLMILGTQWYIVFNVLAGANAFPTDLREAAASFRIRGWRWWRDVMLPGIFPYYVTGAINAAGGAWSASIVAEVVSWGSVKLTAVGLGAYIAAMTEQGDIPRVTLGVAVMSLFVVCINRGFWRPLYALAERRTRLD